MPRFQSQFPTPGTSADLYLTIDTAEVQKDVANNRTRVSWVYFIHKVNAQGGPWRGSPGDPASATVGSLVFSGINTYDFRSPNNYAGAVDIIGSGELWINHAPNGTATITVAASYDGDGTIGDASFSTTWTLAPIPRAPGAPNLTSLTDALPASFRANFTAPSDIGGGAITGYELQVALDSGFTSGVHTFSGPGSPIDATGLTPASLYYARVRAINAYGNGAWSNVRTISTAAAGAPHIDAIPRHDGQGAMLVASPPFGVGSADSYTFQRTVTGPGAPPPTTFTSPNPWASDSHVLQPGQTATYQVYATIGGTDTGWSTSASLAYAPIDQRAPFYPIFDGDTAVAPFDLVQVAGWDGTVGQSASFLESEVPAGWRSFSEGAGGLATGNVSQLPQSVGIRDGHGTFDVMALFASDKSDAGVRIGTATSHPGLAEVFETVTYFGSLRALSHVAVSLAAEIEWYTDDLSFISRTQGAPTTLTPWAPVTLEVSGQAPAGAAYAALTTVDVGPLTQETFRLVGSAMLSASRRYGYFDGDMPGYEWRGDPHESPTQRLPDAQVDRSLQDPDEPPLPAPPLPPAIDDGTVLTDIVWRRYVAFVPAAEVREWIAAIPTLTLRTGAAAEREVRIRFWRNPDEIPPTLWTDAGQTHVAELVISYIPPTSTFVVDGVAERAYVLDADDTSRIPADHLLFGAGGGPVAWPALDCGMAYIITFDVPIDATLGNLETFLDLTDRIV